MELTSPRSTAPYQIPQSLPITTSPITTAVSARKVLSPISGVNPRTDFTIAIPVSYTVPPLRAITSSPQQQRLASLTPYCDLTLSSRSQQGNRNHRLKLNGSGFLPQPLFFCFV